ncbi:unnamed protein product, partial [marine sediment metagenome]
GKGLGFKKGHPFYGDLSKPNYFKKGCKPWNYGIKMSKEEYEKRKRIGFFEPKFGKKASSWIDGRNSLNENLRKSSKFAEWRNKIFKKDNYTCQCCKKRGFKINAHHIRSFSQLVKIFKIKTSKEGRECRELWDIENGIILCKNCHLLFHKIYKNNNTKEQLKQFLNQYEKRIESPKKISDSKKSRR